MRQRKVVGFDLDTNAMQQYYPSKSWRNGYEDIKKFMLSHGFEWRQGSIYISKEPIESKTTLTFVKSLVDQQPWLNLCMRDCIMANIGSEHSLNALFDKSYKEKKNESIEKNHTKVRRR